MTRAEALSEFSGLPLPFFWHIYATSPIGDVASAVPGNGRIMRAALLLHELGLAQVAQRRTENGTEYLIKVASHLKT